MAGVAADTTATPDPREVATTLWIPLPALRDEAASGELVLELDDGPRTFPSIEYGEHVIWGLTHRILVQFLEIVDACGL